MTIAKFLCNYGIVKHTLAENKNNKIDFVLADGYNIFARNCTGVKTISGIHREGNNSALDF